MPDEQNGVGQAAKTAEKAAKAARVAALFANPWAWIAIAVVAVVFLLVFLVGIAVAGIAGSGGGGGEEVAESGPIAGLPDISDIEIKEVPCGSGSAPGGCYQLPPTSEYWSAYASASNLTGSKCLVQLVAATSKAWKQQHPGDTVFIGDLNAPGHDSHSTGEDVDIYTSTAGNMDLGSYTRSGGVEYGKLWFSTKNIEYIFFNDTSVHAPVNGYAGQEGLSGVMMSWPNHEDHFHVRVTPKANGECSRG